MKVSGKFVIGIMVLTIILGSSIDNEIVKATCCILWIFLGIPLLFIYLIDKYKDNEGGKIFKIIGKMSLVGFGLVSIIFGLGILTWVIYNVFVHGKKEFHWCPLGIIILFIGFGYSSIKSGINPRIYRGNGTKNLQGGIMIGDMPDAVFGDVNKIEEADCLKYRSCRGRISYDELMRRINIICAATDFEIDDNDDLSEEVFGKLLYDELSHQYTLYSLTPIALYYICKKRRELGSKNRHIDEFIESVSRTGTNGIYINEYEMIKNKNGDLPFYKIEDIIKIHKKSKSIWN